MQYHCKKLEVCLVRHIEGIYIVYWTTTVSVEYS